ncbi:MAG: NADH-quinone oxidoreductase subunit C [Cyanobacteria bacterium SIG31]|nr:NADH-quinone oxidoreductase subunit C [Cyanobacteria bacterium SIG31]
MNWLEFKNIFGDSELVGDKIVIKSNLNRTIEFIKKNYHFDFLKEILAVDKMDEGIELIYRLYSIDNEEEVLVSITVIDDAESVSNIFDSAVADEKEIYDLFGINFVGNKELKRLYMPESWEGHPLKKNYVEKDERLSWNE